MTPCVLWTGRLDAEGYGRRWDAATQRVKLAHRLAWEQVHNVALTREQVLHHTCHAPACINVEHLVLTTRSAHRRDHHRGQGPPCPHGEAPKCVACRRASLSASQRRWKAKRKAEDGCQLCLEPRYGNHRLCRMHRDRENDLKALARIRNRLARLQARAAG